MGWCNIAETARGATHGMHMAGSAARIAKETGALNVKKYT